MLHYIPTEIKEEIRSLVKSGKSRYEVAIKFGISTCTAFRITSDLPKLRIFKRIKKEDKDKLRSFVAKGMTRLEASKKVGMSLSYATTLTRDLPIVKGGNRKLGMSSIEIIQKILRDGYFIPN